MGIRWAVAAGGSFTFSTPLPSGSSYNVTVSTQPASQTCTVSAGTGTVGTSNVTSVVVNCSGAHIVGGTISGLSGTVVLANNGNDTVTTSNNGSFAFSKPISSGSLYNVTVSTQPQSQTCTVSGGTGTVGAGDITNVAVSCAVDYGTLGPATSSSFDVSGVFSKTDFPYSPNGTHIFTNQVSAGQTQYAYFNGSSDNTFTTGSYMCVPGYGRYSCNPGWDIERVFVSTNTYEIWIRGSSEGDCKTGTRSLNAGQLTINTTRGWHITQNLSCVVTRP